MALADVSPPRFRLDRVIQLTGSVIRRNVGLFLILALLINVPLVLVAVTVGQPELAQGDFTVGGLVAFLIGLLIFIVGYVVLQAAIIHVTVLDLNGRRPPLGESLAVGLRQFFPLIAISLLCALGVGLGMVLLLVPGFMLLCMWAVVVPVRVVERAGILESFARARELTRGHRWSIFGLFVIYLVLEIVIGMVIGGFAAAFGQAPTPGEPFSALVIVSVVGNVISNTISSVVLTAGLAALYYELRVVKEGIGPEALASVFD